MIQGMAHLEKLGCVHRDMAASACARVAAAERGCVACDLAAAASTHSTRRLLVCILGAPWYAEGARLCAHIEASFLCVFLRFARRHKHERCVVHEACVHPCVCTHRRGMFSCAQTTQPKSPTLVYRARCFARWGATAQDVASRRCCRRRCCRLVPFSWADVRAPGLALPHKRNGRCVLEYESMLATPLCSGPQVYYEQSTPRQVGHIYISPFLR